MLSRLLRKLPEEAKELVEKTLDDSLSQRERVGIAERLVRLIRNQAKLDQKYDWRNNLIYFFRWIRYIKCKTLSGIHYLDEDINTLIQHKKIFSDELRKLLTYERDQVELKVALDALLKEEEDFLKSLEKIDEDLYLTSFQHNSC